MHLNITLRQQDRLCVSCLSKLGLAFPMKPDFHNRLRCSLPELNLRANLHQLKSELAPKSCLSTCAPAEDSPAMCRGGGGKGSHTSLSPPFSPPPCLPSLGMMADPTPGLSTRSLHPPWQDQVWIRRILVLLMITFWMLLDRRQCCQLIVSTPAELCISPGCSKCRTGVKHYVWIYRQHREEPLLISLTGRLVLWGRWMFVAVMSWRGVPDVTVDLVQEGWVHWGRSTVTTSDRFPCQQLGGGGRAEDIVQTLAERIPRLSIELGPVGQDQVFQTGNPRPGFGFWWLEVLNIFTWLVVRCPAGCTIATGQRGRAGGEGRRLRNTGKGKFILPSRTTLEKVLYDW